jgi:hypothetical protein
MSPRSHFADYAKRNPKEYKAFTDSVWNSFVSVTHMIGLSKFFSFTPALEIINDPIKDGEAVGAALGEIYQFSKGIEIDTPNQPL